MYNARLSISSTLRRMSNSRNKRLRVNFWKSYWLQCTMSSWAHSTVMSILLRDLSKIYKIHNKGRSQKSSTHPVNLFYCLQAIYLTKALLKMDSLPHVLHLETYRRLFKTWSTLLEKQSSRERLRLSTKVRMWCPRNYHLINEDFSRFYWISSPMQSNTVAMVQSSEFLINLSIK